MARLGSDREAENKVVAGEGGLKGVPKDAIAGGTCTQMPQKRIHSHAAGGNSSPGAIGAQQAGIHKTETKANDELASRGHSAHSSEFNKHTLHCKGVTGGAKLTPEGDVLHARANPHGCIHQLCP